MKSFLPFGASDQEKIAASISNISDELGDKLFYLTKAMYDTALNLKDSSNKLNETLKKSSESADKHSTSMKYLTFGLVAIAVAQVIVAYLPYREHTREVDARKNCFQSVLQTSNIDLNYKNCLRDNGIVE